MSEVLFIWENLGPTHDDRLRAAARAGFRVTAIQFSASSNTYSWDNERDDSYRVVTLFGDGERIGFASLVARLWRAIRQTRAKAVFFCHYEVPAVFAVATLLRLLTRRRPVMMINSKFDDRPRHLGREIVKRIMLWPYRAAMTSSRRSLDYITFLGFDPARCEMGYNSIDTARIREQAGPIAVPSFAERPFVIVARLVDKKNIAAAIEAVAILRRGPGIARKVVVLGDGPLEGELKRKARDLGVDDLFDFRGFVQTREVSRILGTALALVLPSIEEQFGFVVIEAFAMGVPAICTANAGAVDIMVRNGVNGFVVDPYDPATIASAMKLLDGDPVLHSRMAQEALAAAPRGDAALFAQSVGRLAAR